jgi:hypothetical protein
VVLQRLVEGADPQTRRDTMIRSIITAGLAAAALTALAAPAFAGKDETQERTAAIGACRLAIAEKTGVAATGANIDFHRSTTKGRTFELRFQVRNDGASLGAASCVYQRRDEKVASVDLDAQLIARLGVQSTVASQ